MSESGDEDISELSLRLRGLEIVIRRSPGRHSVHPSSRALSADSVSSFQLVQAPELPIPAPANDCPAVVRRPAFAGPTALSAAAPRLPWSDFWIEVEASFLLAPAAILDL